MIYDIKKSLEMSQHKIKATELNFQDFEGEIYYFCLFVTNFCFWSPRQKSKQIKTHTARSGSIIYDLREALGLSQHKIKAPILDFRNGGGQIRYFLLIFDQFLVLETNINIYTDQNTHQHISFYHI